MGGNDIGFVEFAAACATGYCDVGSLAYSTALNRISTELPGKLEDAYGTILDEMKPDSKLYVLGYPHAVPVKTALDLPVVQCAYLYNGNSGSGTETAPNPWGNARGAYDITARINAAIELAAYEVSLMDSRVEFIDVNSPNSSFAGRDVCSPEPFFKNISIATPEASLHPNISGHEALAHHLGGSM